MNGVHDMGGMHGMGPIAPEPNEPVFHERWEARVEARAASSGRTRTTTSTPVRAARASRERSSPRTRSATSTACRTLLFSPRARSPRA